MYLLVSFWSTFAKVDIHSQKPTKSMPKLWFYHSKNRHSLSNHPSVVIIYKSLPLTWNPRVLSKLLIFIGHSCVIGVEVGPYMWLELPQAQVNYQILVVLGVQGRWPNIYPYIYVISYGYRHDS